MMCPNVARFGEVMAAKIFINYRRDDAIGTAGRLHDRLAQTFGRNNLFMDVDHIPAGVDFVDYLQNLQSAAGKLAAGKSQAATRSKPIQRAWMRHGATP